MSSQTVSRAPDELMGSQTVPRAPDELMGSQTVSRAPCQTALDDLKKRFETLLEFCSYFLCCSQFICSIFPSTGPVSTQ